jgi:endoglucanase
MLFLAQVLVMLDFNSNPADSFATGLILPTSNSDPLTVSNPLISVVNSAPLPEAKTVASAMAAPTTATAPNRDPLTGAGLGLLAEYYDDITFTNLKKIALDATVNFDWGRGAPLPGMGADTFSVRWTGQIQPKYGEEYTFKTTSDDGVRLWVDGKLIIDYWKDQPALPHTGKISLEAGKKYDIRLEYYDNAGAASEKLAWTSSSQKLEIVPQSQLYPTYTSNSTIPSAVEQSYSINPDTIGLRINSGGVLHRQQIPYQVQPGDITGAGGYITRDGKLLGKLLADGKTIALYEKVVGPKLDLSWADTVTSYRVTSTNDPNFAQGVAPISISRKTKPSDTAETGNGGDFNSPQFYDSSQFHDIYLKLPVAMQAGKNYQIDFIGDKITDTNFKYDPDRQFSEAVHVNQLGFDPDDAAKVAFLSTWTGTGGAVNYQAGTKFWLINEQTGQKDYEGQIQLSKSKDDLTEQFINKNLSKTDVYMMDFSAFKTTGKYRVAVDGVGTSFPFEINDQVWNQAFKTSVKGMYNQRSGIAMTEPYTNAIRPRSFHPDDGVQVYKSGVKLMDTDMGIGSKNNFAELVAQATTEIQPNAWGGWRDAGDWDRRIQHMEVSRHYLELAELFPDYVKTVNLNIPESNNNIPDLVDEALWGVDFFQRMQAVDGGVSGGIDSADHPRFGDASWQESLKVYAYAPDVWSSYLYAGAAAKAAGVVAAFDPARSQSYKDSAVKAIEWAEKDLAANGSQLSKRQVNEVRDARNLASAELYNLTGDDRWNQLFLNTTVFKDAKANAWQFDGINNIVDRNQLAAAFTYAHSSQSGAQADVKTNAKNSLMKWADTQLKFIDRSAFKQSAFNGYAGIDAGNGLGTPQTTQLLQAHALSNDAKYLKGAEFATQFSAGANPENMVYTTGLGQRSPKNPLIADQRITDREIPGITVYGPGDVTDSANPNSSIKKLIDNFRKDTFPQAQDWPIAESYFDGSGIPTIAEYTVMQTMSPTAYDWGYLAAANNGYTPK